MIDALVIARDSDPAANKVIEVLSDHASGQFSEGKVKYLTLCFCKPVEVTIMTRTRETGVGGGREG